MSGLKKRLQIGDHPSCFRSSEHDLPRDNYHRTEHTNGDSAIGVPLRPGATFSFQKKKKRRIFRERRAIISADESSAAFPANEVAAVSIRHSSSSERVSRMSRIPVEMRGLSISRDRPSGVKISVSLSRDAQERLGGRSSETPTGIFRRRR